MVRQGKPSPSQGATIIPEGGDWSSERLRPHDSTTFEGRSIIPDWASLPPELVEGIADRVLSTTGGVDAYMDMRAVCHSWHFAVPSLRSVIAKASPLAGVADLRFRPRNWVMVDLKSGNHDDDDARLFLHAPTGCFRRLRLPVLRDHLVLGASDGLIVLMERELPHLARVLNPLTGDMIHFAVPLVQVKPGDEVHTAVSGGPNLTLVMSRYLEWSLTVMYADPTSAQFTDGQICSPGVTSMVSFQGDIYYAGRDGCVFKLVAPTQQHGHELVVIAQMDIYLKRDDNALSYLVESAGELLLVRHCDQTLKVFRVDVKHKLLEEVKSIGGSRALFLGDERCVSVDSDKLPSVDGECIYMLNWVETCGYRGHGMHMYNLRDGAIEVISNESGLHANNHPKQNRWDYYTYSANNHHLRPLSLIQVLLDYCNSVTHF